MGDGDSLKSIEVGGGGQIERDAHYTRDQEVLRQQLGKNVRVSGVYVSNESLCSIQGDPHIGARTRRTGQRRGPFAPLPPPHPPLCPRKRPTEPRGSPRGHPTSPRRKPAKGPRDVNLI